MYITSKKQLVSDASRLEVHPHMLRMSKRSLQILCVRCGVSVRTGWTRNERSSLWWFAILKLPRGGRAPLRIGLMCNLNFSYVLRIL